MRIILGLAALWGMSIGLLIVLYELMIALQKVTR